MSSDAALAAALGRLFYLAHLVVILLRLLDKSPQQRASAKLLQAVDANKGWVAMALTLPQVRQLVEAVDTLIRDGVLGEMERP